MKSMPLTIMSKEIDEKREAVIQHVADMLRENPFQFEFKVVKKPKGIRIINEVAKEELDELMKNMRQSN